MNEKDRRLFKVSTLNTRNGTVARHKLANRRNRDSERRAKPEQRKVGDWEFWAGDIRAYSLTFDQVVDTNLRDFLKSRGPAGNGQIMDLMADETVVREAVLNCGFRGGIVVSLGFKSKSTAKDDNSVETVNGDLLEHQTWADIADSMKRKEIEAFDTILSRPLLGTLSITSDPVIHFAMLRKVWRLLSSNNGAFLFQAPEATFPQLERYLQALQSQNLAEVKVGETSRDALYGRPIMIVKKPNSPATLPSPKILGIK